MQELVMAAIEDAQIVQTRRDVTMLVPALFLDDPFFPLHVISLLFEECTCTGLSSHSPSTPFGTAAGIGTL
jgi:hypothetical protein